MRIKAVTLVVIPLCLCFPGARVAFAADPAPQQPGQSAPQPDFSPPPVPEFMLRKPEKPLTLEEMQKQADEASKRARAERDNRPPPQKPTGKDRDEKLK